MRANVIRERDKDRGTRRAPRRKEATTYVAASVICALISAGISIAHEHTHFKKKKNKA